MQSQPIPAMPVGGVTSRCHAKLLLHLVEGDGGGGGASVKDLRLRRVVPPASATLDVSPVCAAAAAAAKPASAQIQSTPPEPAAAMEDRERKPMNQVLPRSKLVRDPASFGYRRLLPFLNQMASKGSDISSDKEMPTENKVSVPNKEVNISDSGLADEIAPVDGSQCGAVPVDSVEPLVVKAGADTEIRDSVKEETKVDPCDLASSKPSLARCTRSRLVHYASSFSYKRMLPFLMENETSSLEADRAKCRRLSEEKQMASDENDVKASGQIQPDTAEVSLDGSVAEVQKTTQEEELTSVGDPLTPRKGELTSEVDAVLAVSEDTPEERNVAKVESTVEEKASKSVEKPVPMDAVEQPVVKAGGAQEAKDCCDSVKDDAKIVPGDLASSKPALPRCTRSKFVPYRSSFSYKRMLPFLMENGISSQKGDMAKFQTVLEEKQLTSPENDVLASGRNLSVSEDSPEACYQAELDKLVEEITSTSAENYLCKGVQLQPAVAVEEVSLDGSTAEVRKVTQDVLASDVDPLCPDKGEPTSDMNDVLSGGQCQLPVSDYLPKESNVAEAERIAEEKATESDENPVLHGRDVQSAVSDVSPRDCDTDEMKEATEKPVLTSDGDESGGLTSDKGECLIKDQPQLCDSKKSALQDNAELVEVAQCQSSESETETAMVDGGADGHAAPDRQDFVASLGGLLLDVGMVCKPAEPCAIDTALSADEISGCATHGKSKSGKVGILRPCGSPCLGKQCVSPKKLSPINGAFSSASCLKKRGFSPKKLSPKKGILKRHTMGCKGICMCLDCSVFRLRADRAFEFSRKQMQEADDIIVNLLEETASLRSLVEKSSGQQEQLEACQRALHVEEVVEERRRQMLAELNSHCKIPGPRVKFAQYVEEKMTISPSCSGGRKQPL